MKIPAVFRRRALTPPVAFLSSELLGKPRLLSASRMTDPHAMLRAGRKPMYGADGLFYLDTREPHIVSNPASIALTTTAKAMYPAAAFPTLGSGYFSRPGKALRITVEMLFTLPATPGNLSFNVLWGTGADANGTNLLTGTPVAATNATKRAHLEAIIRCITTGTSGSLQAQYICWFDIGLIASPNSIYLAPSGALAAAVTADTTAANIVSIQPLQSGTAGSVQVDDLRVEALN